MKYRVGDEITCYIETRKNNSNYILMRELLEDEIPEKRSFQVVALDKILETYMIILPADIVGWTVSRFHTVHMNVPKAFLGRKFWDVFERYVVSKK